MYDFCLQLIIWILPAVSLLVNCIVVMCFARSTDRERDEMNRKITEARRLQQSLPANKAS